MAKLRISLSSLRRLVRGMLPMLEAEGDDPKRKLPGSGRRLSGGGGETPLITKGYKGKDVQAPYKMPTHGMEREIPPEVFQQILQTPEKQRTPAMKRAADAFRDLPAHHGSIHQRGGMLVYVPDEPHMKTMFYIGVPPKLNMDGSVKEPAKPMAWRLADEMTQDQRRKLGYLDPRDRGKVARPEELRDKPMPGPTLPQAKPKGRSMWDPTGGLDIGGWSEMGGGIPGATQEIPGRGGGIPSHAAKQAAERGAEASATSLNPRELSLGQLRQALQAATNRWKDSHAASDKRMMQDIQGALHDRLRGVPPQRGPKK